MLQGGFIIWIVDPHVRFRFNYSNYRHLQLKS